VGLADRLEYRPGQLSGGERQRVAVARALINQPALLLADEPTGSLDRAAAEHLTDLLAELNREEGVTLVVVTHAAPLAARMGRVMELKDGRLAPAK
jgi:lipoprotein-releasing system ATP-binding protein